MSNASEVEQKLQRYLHARIPFVSVRTIEPNRILEIMDSIQSRNAALPVYVYSSSKGVYELSSGRVLCDDPSFYGSLDYITDQCRKRASLTFVLSEVPDLSTETPDTQQLLSLVRLANERSIQIIVITHGTIWNLLQRQGLSLTLDLPSEEEMFDIIYDFISEFENSIQIEWTEDDYKEAAVALNGISKIEAENTLASLVARKYILRKDIEQLRFTKDSLFSDISGLEKISVDPSIGTVGGLEGLQKWLAEKKELFTPDNIAQLKKDGLRPPRGILLVGVPGCGKSLSAKAISANWNLPLYRLDFATVQGQYVGQSEHQLREALTTAENVAPCILWIDEIEKGLSGARTSNDGGVSTRMVGQFLFWLQECEKQVFVVATANDVSMLPSELLRRGRFDELFFVDLPGSEERSQIINLYFSRYLHRKLSADFLGKIIELTEGFSGADIESTIRELAYRERACKSFVLNGENIINTFNNVVPLSQTSPEQIQAIRDWGKERAVPASGREIGQQTIDRIGHKATRKILF